MARMETNCDMDFLKKCQGVSFSKVQVRLENGGNFVTFLLHCRLLQETAFNHLVRAN